MPTKSARPSKTSTRSNSARQSARGGASGRPAGGGKKSGGGSSNKTTIIVVAAVALVGMVGLAVAFGGGNDNVRKRPARPAAREAAESSRPLTRPLRKLTTRKEIDDNLASAKRRLSAANQGGSNAARNRERQEAVFLCDEVLQCSLSTDADKKLAQKLKYEAKKTMTR